MHSGQRLHKRTLLIPQTPVSTTAMAASSYNPDIIGKRMKLQHLPNQKAEATYTVKFKEWVRGSAKATATDMNEYISCN